MPSELFTEKFCPRSFDEFIGNSEIVSEVQSWALAWDKGKKQIPLLLWGSTGTGKTALAILAARMMKWDLFELNASDLRSREVIEKVVSAAAQNSSISGTRRLVLLDEVDGLQANDRGGTEAIASLLRDSQNPVILTANEIYGDRKFQGIRVACKNLEFKKINYLSIASRLKEICSKEKIAFEEDAVKELAKNSNGDFRSALLDLQSIAPSKISMDSIKSLGERERQQKIFSVMKEIFKGTEFNKVREARNSSDLSFDMLFAWVEENIPRQYTDPNDCARAFNYLSRADEFQGRIYRSQDYGLFRYTTELATTGVALAREKEYPSFVPYQFPSIISRLSRSISERSFKKGLALKIGAKTNSSSRKTISSDFAFIKMIAQDKKKLVEFAAEFDLNEKEIAFLLDSKPETAKVMKAFEEAQELRKMHALEKSSRVFSSFGGKKIAEETMKHSLHEKKEKDEEKENEEKAQEEKHKSPKAKQMKLF